MEVVQWYANTFQWTDAFPSGGAVTVSYQQDSAVDQDASEQVQTPALSIDLTPLVVDAVLPGSVKMVWGGKTYIDRAGVLYHSVSPSTNAGEAAGTIDYGSGVATITDWTGGVSASVSVPALATVKGQVTCASVFFRTPGAPLILGSLQVRATGADGGMVVGTSDMNGFVTGTKISGRVDTETGVVRIAFGTWVEDSTLSADDKAAWWYVAPVAPATKTWVPYLVIPSTIKFDCVLYSYLPLDADVIGVDAVRLPQDGRVAIYKAGDVVVIHNTMPTVFPNPVGPGDVISLGRTRLAYAHVVDQNGVKVNTAMFTSDLDAGTVTMANTLDLSAYDQPLVCEHRIEDMALVTDVQITGQVGISSPLSHAFAADNSYLSSALVMGDLQSRVANWLEQTTWTGVWSDTIIGTAPTSSYNKTVYPATVTNAGAIHERWALIFTSAADFRCVGESVGQIAVGNITSDFAPINPNTGVPYFTILASGWGSGWAVNNCVRFQTLAANYPVWIARTVAQGPATVDNDSFRVQIRGDAD